MRSFRIYGLYLCRGITKQTGHYALQTHGQSAVSKHRERACGGVPLRYRLRPRAPSPGGALAQHPRGDPIGREASGEEYNPDDRHFFTDGYGNYRLLEELDRSQLNDILEVFNDLYGADCFAVIKTPIGYGYYKCVND